MRALDRGAGRHGALVDGRRRAVGRVVGRPRTQRGPSPQSSRDERRIRVDPDAEPMTQTFGVVGRLLDLALPATCAGCGVEGEPLCMRCRPELDARLDLPPGTPLGLADGPPDPLLQLEWCSPFAGVTRRALHILKYAGEQRLARPLGLAVARRWRAAGAGGELLVAVPVHVARRRERGYDQAELIARVAADGLGLPYSPALVRSRATVAQYRLDRRHRARNVARRVRDQAGGRVGGARQVGRAGGRHRHDRSHAGRVRRCAARRRGGSRERRDGRTRTMTRQATVDDRARRSIHREPPDRER